jgi:acetyl-CoA carboxylase biotin carboxyl carrier protein
MSQNDATRVNGYTLPRDDRYRIDDATVDLLEVQRQTVELLGQLDRHPRNLRIQVGEVSLELTWPDEPAPAATPVAGPAPVPPAAPVEKPEPVGEYLTSPGVGVFYHAREPGAEPFVSVGSTVHKGQQIGVIEAMKLMLPVEADRSGRITSVVKGNGEPVEYAEPLFAIDPEPDRG